MDTLATLDLTEKPGQRITEYRYRRHHGAEQEVGAGDFDLGAHHSHYSYGEVMSEGIGQVVLDGIGRPYKVGPRVGEKRLVDGYTEEWRGEIFGWHRQHRPLMPDLDAKARLETDSDKRKAIPLYSGLLRYFPDALAEVARLSQAGNDKHNPGDPLHWARSKSGDELDSLMRHLAEAGTIDTDGLYHDVKIAWRALANLQKLLERERGLPISPGSRA